MKEPLVSVLMPYYGGFEFIEEAIKSLENQTYKNFELIVVDDCFPGIRASEVLDPFNFSWLKVIRHDANKGLASVRNTGFENSQGELILPFDDDDLLEPQFLEKTVAALVHDTTAVGAYSQVAIFGDREETWIPLFTLVTCGTLGAVDDYISVKGIGKNKGMSASLIKCSTEK